MTGWLCNARPAEGSSCDRCQSYDVPEDVLIKLGQDWLCEPCVRAELRDAEAVLGIELP